MSLTLDQVRKIATLARLRLEAEEEVEIARQLAEIVAYMDQLREVEVEGAGAEGRGSDLEPLERGDESFPGLPRDAFLENAPEILDGFLVVPEVKGDG
jgi:aspartyl-tRNA(Asn)/glutamyl-tRNA(Gln) amidotransferase subunit C